jgi:ATP-binding protein involved in chromosome partitioning
MSFRTYHQVTGADRSQLGAQVARQRAQIAARLAGVDRVIAVLSGKGGVGKSHVTALLAVALAQQGLAVGVVDADLQSPTVARLLGVRAAQPLVVRDDGVLPAIGRDGVRVISSDLLLDEGRALRWTSDAGEEHVWRGAVETGMLREFLGDVAWGELDVLLVDMPPEASRLADLAVLVPRLTGALVLTIPTPESERSVSRALDVARDSGVPVLGIVENMSGYICPSCDTLHPLFDGDAGLHLAAAYEVPLLGRLPFTRGPLEAMIPSLAAAVDAVLAAGRVP